MKVFTKTKAFGRSMTVQLRYLYIDINMAINAIHRKLGLGPVSMDTYYNRLLDQLNKYMAQNDATDPFNDNYYSEMTRIARNFDSFIRRHSIKY